VDVADSAGRRVKPRSSKQAPASEVVREAIRDNGLPIRELARRSGVEASVLSRFMSQQVGISLTTFEKLAPELGLRVIREANRKRKS
jgi:transcriptional regulator with XRE-family HTH domain